MQYLVTTDRKVIFMDMEELPKELQPIDTESGMQKILANLKERRVIAEQEFGKAKDNLDHLINEIKFYEKAIKSYNKAFKK